MLEHLSQMQQEDYEQLQKKKEAQVELMKEIDKSNQVSNDDKIFLNINLFLFRKYDVKRMN